MGALDDAHLMTKWAEVAMEEVLSSQKSSEVDEFFEADAMRSLTPDKNECRCEEDVDSEQDMSVTAKLGEWDTESCADRVLLCTDDAGCATSVRPLWWVTLLRQHLPIPDPSDKSRLPVKVLSGCSGMLSEAKVFEASGWV